MSEVVTCPNCDKKLTLKDELKGRALVCPECKNQFTPPVADGFDTTSGEDPAPGGSHMDFLNNLASAPGPAAAKAATKAPAAGRPAATARPSPTAWSPRMIR